LICNATAVRGVANLLLVGCALAVILAAVHIGTDGWYAAGEFASVVVAILGFPVGWISMLGASTCDSGEIFILGAVFLPLNAYLWGYIVAAVVRRGQNQSQCLPNQLRKRKMAQMHS